MKQTNTRSINMDDRDDNELVCLSYIHEDEHLGISSEEAKELCKQYGLQNPKKPISKKSKKRGS